mgnify:CR=1 FL=1
MIGVLKSIFDQSVDEMTNLYLQAKDTAFATPSPVIVDIDAGKIMQIEKYRALKEV